MWPSTQPRRVQLERNEVTTVPIRVLTGLAVVTVPVCVLTGLAVVTVPVRVLQGVAVRPGVPTLSPQATQPSCPAGLQLPVAHCSLAPASPLCVIYLLT